MGLGSCCLLPSNALRGHKRQGENIIPWGPVLTFAWLFTRSSGEEGGVVKHRYSVRHYSDPIMKVNQVEHCCTSEECFQIFYPFPVSYFRLVTNKGLNVHTASSHVTLRKIEILSPEAQHLGIFEVTYFSSLCQRVCSKK